MTSAISFAMIIEPKYVTKTRANATLRILPNAVTIFPASHSKNLRSLSALTTARVQKRQDRVSGSK